MENCQGLGCKLHLARGVPNRVVLKTHLNSKFCLDHKPFGKNFPVKIAQRIPLLSLHKISCRCIINCKIICWLSFAQPSAWLQVYPALKGEEKMYNML